MKDHDRFTGSTASTLQRISGPVEDVRGALENAERLCERIENLSRRLVGSTPEEAARPGEPHSDGLLYEMSSHANRVSYLIGDAESAISRIERALP